MIELRYYQTDCSEAVFTCLKDQQRKLGIVMPTGSGKTETFASIIKKYLEMAPNNRVVVVSHLGLLVTQTGKRFREGWGIDTGVLQGQRYPNAQDRCVVTTMQSFRELSKVKRWTTQQSLFSQDHNRLNVGMIIVDEAHSMGSDSYDKIVKMFPNAIYLGFTATPFRKNKLMTKQFDKVAYTISMQELIDKGYLVPPELHMTPYDTDDRADVFGRIIALYKEHHTGQKAVVYCKTIEEAEELRNVLQDAGITARAVTSKLTGTARDELLESYRAGDGPDILTTVNVLTAGFDSPNLQAIFMPYKIGSITQYLQRVGRGLRPYPGKTSCKLYVGSVSPGIEAGFWEKITTKMLTQGGPPRERYDEDLEFRKDDMSREEYKWTKEVVDLSKLARKRGLEAVSKMILSKQFPQELLQEFINVPPYAMTKSKAPPSEKQTSWLKGIGLWQDGMTKNDANVILTAHQRSKGVKPDAKDVVPSGKWMGRSYFDVPHAYWSYLRSKDIGHGLLKQYDNWRKARD